MALSDSLDKVIGTYFAVLCAEPFTYKRKTYAPSPLDVSPLIFRGFTCPANCAGCCPRFTLDYLPFEDRPEQEDRFAVRKVLVNGKEFDVISDMQKDNDGYHCRNVRKEDGRCMVHGVQPFSCDFELIRFIQFAEDRNIVTQKLFGRGWAMRRIDGGRGALCEMTPVDAASVADVVRKLKRLQSWMQYFEVPSKIDAIIAWAEKGPHTEKLVLK